MRRTNWSGNYAYRAASLLEPRSVEELAEMVAQTPKVRALGTRHAFNDIADTIWAQVSLKHLQGIAIDHASCAVTVEGGVTYATLAARLAEHGFALHNLASLPHIAVAGATATATHGSGLANGNLTTALEAIELVQPDGQPRWFRRDSPGWEGVAVSLGAAGIVARLALRCEPAYEVRQDVFEHLPFAVLTANLRAVFASGYSVSVFTDWVSRTGTQVWVKRRMDREGSAESLSDCFGAPRATRTLHPLPGHDARNCTPQMGVPGSWHERLPHFRSDFTPSSGNELQSEYFVAFADGPAAIEAVAALGTKIAPLLYVGEMRSVAADDLWLSPCNGRESLALHFTWKPDWAAVRALLPEIEAALAPFAARPHWAKVFTMDATQIGGQYPRLDEFRALCRRLDPDGKFRNAFLDTYVFGA